MIKLRLHGHDELKFTEVLKIICLESFIKSSIESLFLKHFLKSTVMLKKITE